jgi:hypothetical protein
MRLRGVGIVPNNAQTLQNVTSVDDFLNVAATETVPLFEYLELQVLLEYDVFAPIAGGEHEFMSHQNSSKAFSTATTRMSTTLSCRTGTPEAASLADLWLRSTVVERRGRSIPY